jgi:ribonuclease P protein component
MASRERERRFGLPRRARIARGGEFVRLKETGRRAPWGCMMANWLPAAAGSASRLGVIVSRRLGGAVARNRARRLLKESFRLHQHELAQPLDLVLVARNSIVGRVRAEVERDFLAGLARNRLLKQSTA